MVARRLVRRRLLALRVDRQHVRRQRAEGRGGEARAGLVQRMLGARVLRADLQRGGDVVRRSRRGGIALRPDVVIDEAVQHRRDAGGDIAGWRRVQVPSRVVGEPAHVVVRAAHVAPLLVLVLDEVLVVAVVLLDRIGRDRLQDPLGHPEVLDRGEQRIGPRPRAEERYACGRIGLDAAEPGVLVVGRAVAVELRQGLRERGRAERVRLERIAALKARERLVDLRVERRVRAPGRDACLAARIQRGIDARLRHADHLPRGGRIRRGQRVVAVHPGRDQGVDEVGPAVLRRGGGEPHALAAGALPRRVRQRQPREAAAVGAARRDNTLGVDVERRVVGEQPGQVLVVVDLEAAGVELRLACRAVAVRVHEAARRVGEDDVAARGEPGVRVVPLLAASVDARGLPARLVARAAAVHHHDQRVAAGRRRVPRRVWHGDVDVERDLSS